MAVRENRVEAVVVAFMDMAGWDFGFRGIPHKGGPKAGIMPGINLFETPDFCGAEAVKNSNRAGGIGHIGQVTTGPLAPTQSGWPLAAYAPPCALAI